MAFSAVPTAWMAGYSETSGTMNITNAGDASGDTAIGTTFSCASANILTTATAHGLSMNQIVKFVEVTTLPTGLSAGTAYYVIATPSATTFQVSTSRGGSTVSISADGTADNTITLFGMLPELTTAEADEGTGDVRDIMYALSEWMYQCYNAKVTADRPNRMTFYKSVSTNATTGIQTVTYTCQYELTSGAPDVADEE